ncbi:MAG: dTDP-4-dehydrorhamnose reductase [Verrucomicrobiales bacterium]
MKIAITGTGGRLGGALARLYAPKYEVTALDRAALDLGDHASLRSGLEQLDFDLLINPAASTSLDYCEEHAQEAERVNAVAPGVMAEVCASKGARFIHLSTDYVFGGEDPGLRSESDPTAPKSVYGRSKLAGEKAVLAVDPKFLVVRTSWVFGPDRSSFVDMIVSRALEQQRVEAIADKQSTPTYAEDFSQWLEPLLAAQPVGGILHLCNGGCCSWQQYAQAALDCAAQTGLPLKTHRVEAAALAEMDGFIAERPRFTAMSTERYRGETGDSPRPWREAVSAYVRDVLAPRLAKG